MQNFTPRAIPIKAQVNGVWRVVGLLRYEGGRPVFEQRIKRGDILRIRGTAGVDVQYNPPLPPNTIIRHRVGGTTYEIPLEVLLSHPKTKRERIGPLHPERCYLSYRYWHRVGGPKQMELFAAGGEG